MICTDPNSIPRPAGINMHSSRRAARNTDLPEWCDDPVTHLVYRNTDGVEIYEIPELKCYMIGYCGHPIEPKCSFFDFRIAIMRVEHLDVKYIPARTCVFTPMNKRRAAYYQEIAKLKMKMLRPFVRSNGANNG